jgi:hypothetical protein
MKNFRPCLINKSGNGDYNNESVLIAMNDNGYPSSMMYFERV